MIKPISPDELIVIVPDYVITAFNKLLQRKWDGVSVVITVDEAYKAIRAECGRATKIETRWLNIEPLYRAEGWDVSYEKTGFNDASPDFFTFKKRRKPSDI